MSAEKLSHISLFTFRSEWSKRKFDKWSYLAFTKPRKKSYLWDYKTNEHTYEAITVRLKVSAWDKMLGLPIRVTFKAIEMTAEKDVSEIELGRDEEDKRRIKADAETLVASKASWAPWWKGGAILGPLVAGMEERKKAGTEWCLQWNHYSIDKGVCAVFMDESIYTVACESWTKAWWEVTTAGGKGKSQEKGGGKGGKKGKGKADSSKGDGHEEGEKSY